MFAQSLLKIQTYLEVPVSKIHSLLGRQRWIFEWWMNTDLVSRCELLPVKSSKYIPVSLCWQQSGRKWSISFPKCQNHGVLGFAAGQLLAGCCRAAVLPLAEQCPEPCQEPLSVSAVFVVLKCSCFSGRWHFYSFWYVLKREDCW